MSAPAEMRQVAPYPLALDELVGRTVYKAEWTFSLEDVDRGQGSQGFTLCILISPQDAYHPERMRRVMHYIPVPPAAFDQRSWTHWLFEQILFVERHEACEHFQVGDDRPYAPSHGPGNDPYLVREVGTLEDRETSYLGKRNGGNVQ